MKKVLSIILAAVLLMSLFACGRKNTQDHTLTDHVQTQDQSKGSGTHTKTENEAQNGAQNTVQDDASMQAYSAFLSDYGWIFCFTQDDFPHRNFDQYEWGNYYFHDFNGDGTAELIMIVGTTMSNAKCIVFTYEDGQVQLVDFTSCAYGVGVAYIPGEPTIVLCEYHGEYENFTAVTVDVEGYDMEVTHDLALLPENAVPMDPTGVGSEATAGIPSASIPSADGQQKEPGSDSVQSEVIGTLPEGFHMPNERLFIGVVEDTYSGYDHSGIYVEQYFFNEYDMMVHCMVALPVSHAYADEIISCHVAAPYDEQEGRLGMPRIIDTFQNMTWHVNGTWTLDGEGVFGTQAVSVRIDSVDAGYVNGAYKIIIEESTFGVADPTKVVEDSGSMYIEAPSHPFGIENCWEFVEVGSGDYMFYLNPDVGVYYSTDKSFTIGLQQMYPVH